MSIDLNDDIGDASSPFNTSMTLLNLHDSIVARHGPNTPPTRETGRITIDSIQVSANLPIEYSGYLPYDDSLSDHVILWTDFDNSSLFGISPSAPQKAHCRRLQCKDPRVVKKYIEYYHSFLIRNHLYHRANMLEKAIREGTPLTRVQSTEYESIDRLRVKGIKMPPPQNGQSRVVRHLRQGTLCSPLLASSLAQTDR